MANTRNAGRKHKFNKNDVEKMLKMISEGKNIEDVAVKFGTSRQVVGRYLNKNTDPNFTHRYIYMFKHKPMTIIDVNFLEKRIKIQNRTDDIYNRAFGCITNPSWEQFEAFLADRVISKSRYDLDKVLKCLELDYYDPLVIIEKTKGKIEGDKFWIKTKRI